MCFTIFFGPIEAPTLHPVIANLFENVYKITVRSFIPGKLAIDIGGLCEYLIS